jgi:hypothetical protein
MAKKPILQLRSADQIAQEIDILSNLSLSGVHKEWRDVFGKSSPSTLTQDLMVRLLAWRLQEEAFGGHDRETLKLLDSYCRQNASKIVLFRRLKPGTSVVREYQGVRHVVTISEDGFVWQDKTYSSLSAIAREITGARWNGPRFFGLRAQNDGKAAVRKAS